MTGEYFSNNYVEARAKFLDAARSAGAHIDSFRSPCSGPEGEALYTDVAVLGSDNPTATLAIGSGTHGIEGFAGSAIQTGLLRDGFAKKLGRGQHILLIHAINPYGFAHLRRVNEDDVDVNRNFVDHALPRPRNPSYDDLAHSIAPASNSRLEAVCALGRLFVYRARFGGQYDHLRGLFYGGRCETWSNQTMRTIIERHLRGTPRIAYLDVHTGLGLRGVGKIIVHDLPASPPGQRAAKWWSDRAMFVESGGSVSVPLNGTLNAALHEALPESEVTAVTLEFGVASLTRTLRALQAENWLHHFGQANHPRAAAIKSNLRDVFYPDDAEWKAMVWAQGRCTMEEVITGFLGVYVPDIRAEKIGCFDSGAPSDENPGTQIVGATCEFDGAIGDDDEADSMDGVGEAGRLMRSIISWWEFFCGIGELFDGFDC